MQVAMQVAVGIRTEDALTHWGRSFVCGAQVVLAAAGCYAYVGETGGVGVVVAEHEGVAGTFGTGDVFAQQALLHQVLYVTAGSVLGALCGDTGWITPQILRQKCKIILDWQTKRETEDTEERTAKREAKELYAKILSGNFDAATLQQINDYIDHATKGNRYYRPLSQRLRKRALLPLQRSGRTNEVDALYSRVCKSTVPKVGRVSAEGRRRIEAKKEELLEKWARATGN